MTQLTKFEPRTELDTWIDDMFRFPRIGTLFRNMMPEAISLPPLDLVEHETESVATLFMPRISKENIIVTVSGREVEVSAKAEDKTEKTGENVVISEYYSNNVYRRFLLNHKVDMAASKAEYNNGSLTLTLAKSKEKEKITNQLQVM